MKRRRRILRRLKWTGTIACGLLVAALVLGGCFRGGWYTFSGGTNFGVELSSGVFSIMLDDYIPSIPAASRPVLVPGWHVGQFQREWPESTHVFYMPEDVNLYIARRNRQHLFEIPLWPVFVVAFIPTLYLWYRDRQPPPGLCSQCGYNLTGSTSGKCPECGESVLLSASQSPLASKSEA